LPFSSRHLAAPTIHAREQPEARKIASLEPIQHRRGRQPEQLAELACREQPLAHAAVSAVPIPSAQPPNMACPGRCEPPPAVALLRDAASLPVGRERPRLRLVQAEPAPTNALSELGGGHGAHAGGFPHHDSPADRTPHTCELNESCGSKRLCDSREMR
jgi:hypothetical protein